ncbi:hypothetical protein [Prescottella equi]|uniref:Head-to-tail stopper n=1 Tax=Prescottella equi ATCC 33707 TaxID=525370 RepID=E9T074_RHOHA|nr:hypothetical protein [Prescottella equi]EGD24657.1 hypothetical protein HMPREF0724_11775 [Prescottella equi ATCC 33707]
MVSGFTCKIWILRPRKLQSRYVTDADGTLDYSNPERIEVKPLVSVQPVSTTERGDNRTSTVTGWELTTPAGVDIPLLDIDRVEYAGMQFSVVGQPLRWPHPIRPEAVHHLEASLQLVTG